VRNVGAVLMVKGRRSPGAGRTNPIFYCNRPIDRQEIETIYGGNQDWLSVGARWRQIATPGANTLKSNICVVIPGALNQCHR